MSEPAKRTISGSTVKRTSDGQEYELQPTDAGQIRLQAVDSEPGDEATLTMPLGQFQLSIKGGQFYFHNDDTSEVMDAVRELRNRRPGAGTTNKGP